MAYTLETVGKDLYIDGSWRPGSDGRRIEILDPATEQPIASVADGSIADGIAAIEAAHRAGPAWAATAPRERAEVLRRAFDLMHKHKESLARLITLENGKALGEARGEVAYAAEFLRWFSEEAVRILGEIGTAPSGTNRMLVIRQPVGVSLFITPWNFPAAMATRKIGPALAAGCSVVLKPAPETPLTALAMAALFTEAGVPAGVVNVIPTSRAGEVTAAMLKDPRVRKLSFTGSTRTGRILLAQAAENVIKCSMELGGNAPFIVCEDADLDVAVASAMVAKLRNGGQSCTAANRFYAHKAVAAEFAKRFAGAMREVKVGPGMQDGTELGPLIHGGARNNIARLVDQALAGGARALSGGKAPAGKGWFYEPTVLFETRDDMPVMREEIFGPVAPIASFESEDEAIELANRTEMGLVSYVQTRDIGRGLRISERLEAGMVGLNRGLVSDPAAPFGGWKQSGIGREGAHEGILEFLETKYIATSW